MVLSGGPGGLGGCDPAVVVNEPVTNVRKARCKTEHAPRFAAIQWSAAIKDAERRYKMSLRSPSLAILAPGLLASLPAKIAAESSMDAIIHGLESYTSNRANRLSEGLSLQSLEYLCPTIRRFVANRSDPVVAERMLTSALIQKHTWIFADTCCKQLT